MDMQPGWRALCFVTLAHGEQQADQTHDTSARAQIRDTFCTNSPIGPCFTPRLGRKAATKAKRSHRLAPIDCGRVFDADVLAGLARGCCFCAFMVVGRRSRPRLIRDRIEARIDAGLARKCENHIPLILASRR